jgi:hypothetical protein
MLPLIESSHEVVLHNYSSDVELTLAADISTSFVECQIADLKVSVDSMEKERDFYFSKLRDIEILCQRPELEHLPVRKKKLSLIFMCLLRIREKYSCVFTGLLVYALSRMFLPG